MTLSSPSPSQPWWPRLLALAAGAALLISCAHPSATRQFTWPWIFVLTLGWFVPCGALFSQLAAHQPFTRPNNLLSFGLIGLTAATLLSASLSPYANHSLVYVWPTLSGVALFFWSFDWLTHSDTESPRRILLLTKGLAGAGAILATVSLVGWLWMGAGFDWSYRNDFPFGHSTYTAGAMILSLPWLALATCQSNRIYRLGWALAMGMAAFVLVATSSRGGVLAFGVMVIAAVGHCVRRAPWSLRAKTLLVSAAMGLLGLAVLTNPRLCDLVQGKGWSDAARESNAQRSAMLVAGAKLGVARPWTGWGPGTVPLIYPQIRGQLSGGVDNVLQLHNTPAQLWATLGTGGLAALLLLLAATTRRARELATQTTDNPASLAAAFALLGYGIFALTDHQLDLPLINSWLVIAAVLFFTGENPPVKARNQPVGGALCPDSNNAFSSGGQDRGIKSLRQLGPAWLRLGVAAVFAALLIPTGRDLAARFTYELALTAFEQNHNDEGRRWLEKSATIAPYDPYYRHQLVGRLLAQRAQTTDPTRAVQLTNDAVQQLQLSLTAGCFQEFARFNLGWLTLEQNRPADAANYFLAAAREAPHRRGVYWGLGVALLRSGQERAAIRAFALEWINDPIACADPVWENSSLTVLRPQVAREADALLAPLTDLPTASYVRALWRWWDTGNGLPTAGFDQASNAFLPTLASVARNLPPQTDANFAAAVTRRAQRHPPADLHGFLTAGPEGESTFLGYERANRFGYGVLARHPDGFMLTDLYLREQNRFVTTYLTPLFPPKGWLPAPRLLKLLDAAPPARH